MASPQQLRQQTPNCSLLLIYRPRKDEMLSWPGWLTCSGWFTHLNGHPSATGRAQHSESTPAKDRRSTAGPCKQPSAAFLSPELSALPCWSCIFRSCIFHPCSLVPHFPVPHFPVSLFQRPRSWLYFYIILNSFQLVTVAVNVTNYCSVFCE